MLELELEHFAIAAAVTGVIFQLGILRDGEPTASGCPLGQHGPQGYLSIRLHVQRGERGFWRNVMLMDPAVQGQGKDCRDVLARCYGSESRFQPRLGAPRSLVLSWCSRGDHSIRS